MPSTQGKMSKVEAKTDKARASDDARGARLHLQNGLSSRPIGSTLDFFPANAPGRAHEKLETARARLPRGTADRNGPTLLLRPVHYCLGEQAGPTLVLRPTPMRSLAASFAKRAQMQRSAASRQVPLRSSRS